MVLRRGWIDWIHSEGAWLSGAGPLFRSGGLVSYSGFMEVQSDGVSLSQPFSPDKFGSRVLSGARPWR
ncbi:unnamed protein product [Brassica rapa]|uniref:Uncharacterized protein n=1 Tax=Brassica campestris TaxID=3711 RepID=A0A8D9LMJ0_BRACM|nr:unnamed protein product [Brassica rapa]